MITVTQNSEQSSMISESLFAPIVAGLVSQAEAQLSIDELP